MFELSGAFNTAIIYAKTADSATVSQIQQLLDNDFSSGSAIRIMPDAHAGKGCVVGTTMTITNRVAPSLVGTDIGCGIEAAMLKNRRLELTRLDKVIRSIIPVGFDVRTSPHKYASEVGLDKLHCAKLIDLARSRLSIGTLGGGNHFIELGRDDSDRLHLVVHSGSRNLGKQVSDFYQAEAVSRAKSKISSPDSAGKAKFNPFLACCEGELFSDYLHDMAIAQEFASWNRKAIIQGILKEMKLKAEDQFTSVHNCIDLDSMILRKGAISAQNGEKAIIPMNMRDGSLICVGKGNPFWNYSAPHGAGRLMSRSDALNSLTVSAFEKSMEGIYSSTISHGTLDESPMAYKPMDEIVSCIGDTVEIVGRVKPIYNFKAEG
jgi:RNA-splicing ligase RtcB